MLVVFGVVVSFFCVVLLVSAKVFVFVRSLQLVEVWPYLEEREVCVFCTSQDIFWEDRLQNDLYCVNATQLWMKYC